MAYRDAYLSHRYNGIYGAMYFAPATASAFVVDEPLEACRIGLSEIPNTCRLYRDIQWALRQAPNLRDYVHARSLVDSRFVGMPPVHTNNNACLTIFGLALGGRDVTKVLGCTVAIGLDNGCTAATAGSIAAPRWASMPYQSTGTGPFGAVPAPTSMATNGSPTVTLSDASPK